MTYVLGPCPVKGCDRSHGVTSVRRSRAVAHPVSVGPLSGLQREASDASRPVSLLGGAAHPPADQPPSGAPGYPPIRSDGG